MSVPGFTFVEQRRRDGPRGGIGILVRDSLQILGQKGNEFAQ